MSPEILLGTGHSYKTDIWSLGILIYELVGGYLPFNDTSPQKMNSKIVSGFIKFPKNMSGTLKELIKNILVYEPEQRLEMEEIQSHLFFKNVDWEQVKSLTMPSPSLTKDKSNKIDTQKYIGYKSVKNDGSSRAKANFLGDFTLIKVNQEFKDF